MTSKKSNNLSGAQKRKLFCEQQDAIKKLPKLLTKKVIILYKCQSRAVTQSLTQM